MISNAVPYTVPHEPGRWQSVILAVTVHALLFTFLGLGINWANNKPETIEAEVWSPQELEKAPPVVVPPPPPVVEKTAPEVEKPQEVDPDIAIERDKLRKKHEKEIADQKAAKDKAELAAQALQDKKKQLDDKRAQEAKEAKIVEAQRKAQRDLITKEANSTGTNGTAAQSQGNKGDPSYAARIRALIKSNTHVLVSSDTNAPAQFEVKLLPGGQILSIKKTGSSGYPEFDEAVERAINLSAPFPPDSTGMVPKVLPINYRPNDQKS